MEKEKIIQELSRRVNYLKRELEKAITRVGYLKQELKDVQQELKGVAK